MRKYMAPFRGATQSGCAQDSVQRTKSLLKSPSTWHYIVAKLSAQTSNINGLQGENRPPLLKISLTVNNRPTKTLVKSMGDLSNGVYGVDLIFSDEEVWDDDKVVIAYHIVNNSSGEASATAYLQQTLGKLADVAVQALANDASEVGAAIGTAIGTAIPVPLVGSALGALAGWLVGDFWGVAFPNCDGPVAAGIHIYTGAEL
ncbi:MAG: hypothetical protein ABSF49_21380, partial [Roseiarcus sp.]|uniref:hypothetical protein n=1 Tax=Roseiarcus sp. TaxID=1969460 RepID=UPI003C23E4A7